MKKSLRLNKESLRVLATDDLGKVNGGWIRPPISWSCPQPSAPCGSQHA
jgi:hypothetical protein